MCVCLCVCEQYYLTFLSFPESFSLVHLTSCFINYVQSESKGAEPTADQLSISVSDGLHGSAPVSVSIIINPTNDETPLLVFTDFLVGLPSFAVFSAAQGFC